eukprot:gnl/TRDRNA2_/TRDRNA2_79164_c0_seq1.p1 gnl/TRDRNA2_/TRDRNA2_79164_c0~~gnl/TRDRNA2_/TRDRNA2_79164_c0_seq1.p1  ORF type:complete len:121 (+),score=10.32 gnl/TRDRNA2_/TRDRNA2_79164_c0_seq1:124-486(+)
MCCTRIDLLLSRADNEGIISSSHEASKERKQRKIPGTHSVGTTYQGCTDQRMRLFSSNGHRRHQDVDNEVACRRTFNDLEPEATSDDALQEAEVSQVIAGGPPARTKTSDASCEQAGAGL